MFKARDATGSSDLPRGYGEDITSFARGRIPLDGYDLNLRRATDAFVVTLRFRNVDLIFTTRGWLLISGRRAPGVKPLVEYDFGSQHLLEEAVYISDWCRNATNGSCNASSTDTLPVPDEVAALAMLRALAEGTWNQLPNPPVSLAWMHNERITPLDLAILLKKLNEDDALRIAFGKFRQDPRLHRLFGDTPSQAPLRGRKAERAQPSHLLFEFGAKERLPFTLDMLFAWAATKDSPFTLVRPKRARELGVIRLANEDDPDKPLITRPLSLRDPLTGPCEYATGIEVPARLVMSPINNDPARWTQSTTYLAASRALPLRNELWSVRLVNTRLRAVFTPDARPVDSDNCPEWPECSECPPQKNSFRVNIFNPPDPYAGGSAKCEFRTTTDSRDRHEIVALTSLYGFQAECGSSQVLDCQGGNGVYMPTPIDVPLLQITSLGANFKFKGFWNPPSSPGGGRGALSVTRYDHHGQIGRDIRTRVEYKGFLFPLGHPAILIKLTERRFCIEKNAHGTQSVASLVQRFFIHVPAFTRAFPTINQPNENRYWGHASISIAEFTTPDLAAPEKHDVAGLGQSAFWPMTLCGEDIAFPFGEANTKSSYSAPQVFIDNNVAHNSTLLSDVIQKWRKCIADQLSVRAGDWPTGIQRGYAQVLSGRLPYVPGTHGDNTDIETDQVLLDVQTPFDNGYDYAAAPPLAMDSRMEAQNQPPFYPVRRRCRVALTQISTITGNAGDKYLMQYDATYGKTGFAKPGNAGQIFAKFVDVAPAMDFSGNTSRSGGFASPSSSIIYLSAQRGLIGGRQSDLEPLVPIAPKLLRGTYVSNAEDDTSGTPNVHDGDFDPTAFFSTFIGDAKLLGIVRIVDILKVALAASGTKIPTITRENLFDLAEGTLRAIVPNIAQQLASVADMFKHEDQIPSAVAARLGPGLADMQADAAALQATLTANPVDDAKMLAQLRDFGTAANAFSSQANAIANEPELLVPADQLAVLKQLKDALDALRQLRLDDLVSGWLRPMAETLVKEAIARQVEELRNAVVTSAEFNSLRLTLQTLKDRANAMATLAQNSGAKAASDLWNDYLQLLDAIAEYRRDVAALVDPALQTSAKLKDDVLKLSDIIKTTLCVIGSSSINTDNVGLRASVFITTVSQELAKAERDLAAQTQLDSDDRGKAERALARGRQAANALADDLSNDIARLRFDVPSAPKPAANGQPAPNAVYPLGADVAVQDIAVLVLKIDYVTTLPRRILAQANRLAEVTQAILDYRTCVGKDYAGKAWDACTTLVGSMGKAFSIMKQAVNNDCADLKLTSLANQFNAFAAALDQFVTDASLKTSPLQAPLAGVAQAARNAATQAIALNTDLTAAIDADSTPGPFDTQAFCNASQDYINQFMTRHASELTQLDAFAADCAKVAQILAWWNGVANKLPTTTATLMQKLASTLDERIRPQVQSAIAAASSDLCAALTKTAAIVAPLANAKASMYLSSELIASLQEVNAQLQQTPCPPADPTWPAKLLAAIDGLGTLLARAASFQGIGRLVDVNKIVTDILAALGVPTRVRVTYDWATDVHAFPEGNDAVFEPLDDRTLTIHATAEAGSQGGPPTATMSAELSSFKINLFGKGSSNFLSITLDRLTLELPPGGKLQCKTNVLLVEPGPALGFVQSLESLFGGDSGFLVLPTFNGIMVGYEYHEDIEELGGFVIQNIAFSIYANLPFDNSPVRFTMKLADKIKPFLMSAGIYGGGGFVGIQTRVDTLELLEASFEYGLVTGFKFGVLVGSGRITAGVYIRLGGRSPAIEGFFCAVGEVSIANLITMGASLRVSLDYYPDSNTMSGTAEYEFHFSIGFVQFSYHVDVQYLRNGDKKKGDQQESGQSAEASIPLAVASDNTPALGGHQAIDPQEHAFSAEAWQQLWASAPGSDNRTTIAQSTCAPLSASLA
ncbi:Uncharacterised protein [Burkholderia pseudomallei]|nr:Uncharacterised protein [Burkholderia pseudomallei]CAJ8045542.1 Uncharacterised protein [Burkholderia pseudomallei]